MIQNINMQIIHLIGGFYGAFITSILMQMHDYINSIFIHYSISGIMSLILYKNNKDTFMEGLYNGVFFGFIFIICSTIIQSFIFVMYTYYVSRNIQY